MKRLRIIWVCLSLLLLAVFAFLSFTKSVPVAIIRVIDEGGKPVAGAVITPDGLRPKLNGGHYGWSDKRAPKPLPVATDADGVAPVPYPPFVIEHLETGEISFSIDHPDFCPDRPFRTVDAAPPVNAKLPEKLRHFGKVLLRRVRARPAPVVLKRGAIVQVSGYIGSRVASVTNLTADVSDFWVASTNNPWLKITPALRECRRIPTGNRTLRLAHAAADGSIFFSEIESFVAVAGATNRFELELKRGRRLFGRLDDSVPRPITNGRVVMEVIPPGSQKGGDRHQWHAWTALAPDGTFSFDSLPPGVVEIVVLCDGFVSRNPPFARRSLRVPQAFTNPPPDESVVIAMEPTAALEVTALGERGQPLPGARVAVWPNVIWADWGTTILCSDLYNSADLLRPNPPDRKTFWENHNTDFDSVADSNGIAVVKNLPIGTDEFVVQHAEYELPVRKDSGEATRARSMRLIPGETNRQTVTLQKRGTDFLHH